MRILSFEGLDKSGKYSASVFLETYLKERGYSVARSEFHRYDTPTGELIMKWLKKEWEVDQKTIELIMAADKQAQQAWFKELDEAGTDFLILDRYTTSQEAYALANGLPIYWIHALQQYMRFPDIEILIDIPAEVSMARKGKHNNGENDRYESDLDLLTKVRSIYLQNSGIQIDGTKPLEEVHKDIVSALVEYDIIK